MTSDMHGTLPSVFFNASAQFPGGFGESTSKVQPGTCESHTLVEHEEVIVGQSTH